MVLLMRFPTFILVFSFIISSPIHGTEILEVVGADTGLMNPFGVAFDDQDDMLIAEYLGGRLWRFSDGQPLKQLV